MNKEVITLENHDEELENHDERLEKAKITLAGVEKDIKVYKIPKSEMGEEEDAPKYREIPEKIKERLIEHICVVLDDIGEMSISRFIIRESLELLYLKKYVHQPELGKELYLTHYEALHKPYDRLKRKCYNLMEILDPYPKEVKEETEE